MSKKKRDAQVILDIILPKNISIDGKMPTDAEAGALYSMWKESPPGSSSFSVPAKYKKLVNSWKIKRASSK